MNYIAAENELLINFQKIRYTSRTESDRKAAIKRENSLKRQINERNESKRELQITRELSNSKNAVSNRVSVKATPVKRSRVNSLTKNEPTTAQVTAVNRNKKEAVANENTVDIRRTAAEMLFYSCEEASYSKTKRVKPKAQFPIAFFVNAIVVTILLILLIGSYSQLSEATMLKGDYESKISACLNEQEKLEQKLAEKRNLDEIERIAVNKLGMVPASTTNVGYISIAGGDKITVTEDSDANTKNVSVVMSGVYDLVNSMLRK